MSRRWRPCTKVPPAPRPWPRPRPSPSPRGPRAEPCSSTARTPFFSSRGTRSICASTLARRPRAARSSLLHSRAHEQGDPDWPGHRRDHHRGAVGELGEGGARAGAAGAARDEDARDRRQHLLAHLRRADRLSRGGQLMSEGAWFAVVAIGLVVVFFFFGSSSGAGAGAGPGGSTGPAPTTGSKGNDSVQKLEDTAASLVGATGLPGGSAGFKAFVGLGKQFSTDVALPLINKVLPTDTGSTTGRETIGGQQIACRKPGEGGWR